MEFTIECGSCATPYSISIEQLLTPPFSPITNPSRFNQKEYSTPNSIFNMAIDTTTYITNTPKAKTVIQLFQKVPLLEPFYTNFEKNYDPMPLHRWGISVWPWFPLTLVTVYMVLIFAGKKYMANKLAYGDRSLPTDHNRKLLVVWNAALSIFSFCGMFRTVPHLLYNLGTNSLVDNICGTNGLDPESNFGAFATGFWVQMFIFSKPFELFDTYFIVVRKRPLIFLHWYHHVTVLLFCWHSYSFEASTGLFFVAMNYSVHAIMYGYYCLMALRIKPKWINPFFITAAQVSQMVVGVTVSLLSYYYKFYIKYIYSLY